RAAASLTGNRPWLAPPVIPYGATHSTRRIVRSVGDPFGMANSPEDELAGMFFLTASAHWGRRRADLFRMVPKKCSAYRVSGNSHGDLRDSGNRGLSYAI